MAMINVKKASIDLARYIFAVLLRPFVQGRKSRSHCAIERANTFMVRKYDLLPPLPVLHLQ